MVVEVRIVASQVQAAHDAAVQQHAIDLRYRPGAAQHKLLAVRRPGDDRVAGESVTAGGSVVRFPEAQGGRLAQSVLAHLAEVDGHAQGDQRLTGADVGGGALAPDMLLAGLQGQDECPAPGLVHGRADDPTGQLADVALTGCEQAD